METFWYILLWILFGLYILFEGYEFGAGIVYLLYARTDEEKRKTLKSIRSVWDANEIWLLAFLGLAYLVFPAFFLRLKESFEEIFYLFVFIYVLQLILQNLIPVFFDRPFRKWLDLLYGISNVTLTVLLGLFVANILRGGIRTGMPLISGSFSPFVQNTGFFDWFTTLFTFFFFILILLHGLGWIIHRTRDAYARKLKFKVKKWAVIEILLTIVLVIAVYFIQKESFRQFMLYPALFVFPVLMISSLSGLVMIRTYAKDNKAFFLGTNFFIYFWTGFIILLYPYLVFFNKYDKGISIFDTEFHGLNEYYLQWWTIGIAGALIIYSIVIHKFYKGHALLVSQKKSK
jgi:cytochrome d ubiquinol oxidase subunit II